MARKSNGMVGVILVSGMAFMHAPRAVIFDDDADDPASEAAGEMRDRAERGEMPLPPLAPGLERNENGVVVPKDVVVDDDGDVIAPPPPISIDRDGVDIDKSNQRRHAEGTVRDRNVGTRRSGTLGNADGGRSGNGMRNSPGANHGSMGNAAGSNAGGGGGMGGGGT